MEDVDAIDAAMAERLNELETTFLDFVERVGACARERDPDWNHLDVAPALRNALDIVLFSAEHELMCVGQALDAMQQATELLRLIRRVA